MSSALRRLPYPSQSLSQQLPPQLICKAVANTKGHCFTSTAHVLWRHECQNIEEPQTFKKCKTIAWGTAFPESGRSPPPVLEHGGASAASRTSGELFFAASPKSNPETRQGSILLASLTLATTMTQGYGLDSCEGQIALRHLQVHG